MQYVLIVGVWFTVSAICGLIGAKIGPGIAMFIMAVIVGAVGSCLNIIQGICGIKTVMLYSGLAVAISSIALMYLIFSMDGMTYQAAVYFIAFISGISYLGSFLVGRFVMADEI